MSTNLKYLIVEDSIKVCEGIQKRLEAFKFWSTCGFAHHVDHAIEKISNQRPQLIFLDWALRGGSAYDVLKHIQNIQNYDPYIIFNTGYQSDNPEIPQEIVNNYKIDKYIVKPIWENLRQNLEKYLNEAIRKNGILVKSKTIIWITDISKVQHHVELLTLVCVLQHFSNPYFKIFYFKDETSITVKLSWQKIIELLKNHSIDYFVSNSKLHIVVKDYIKSYNRPFIYLLHFKQKIEVVKDKLCSFEQWLHKEKVDEV